MPADKIVSRALKLKARTQSDNIHESEEAARQLLRLMREHALSEADLDAAATRVEDPMIQQTCYLDGLQCLPYDKKTRTVHGLAKWKRQLFFAIAEYLGLQSSYISGRAVMSFYGHQSDCFAAMTLYEVCARQIDRECRAHLKAEREKADAEGYFVYSGEARTEGFCFRESAVDGLEAKFADLTEESETQHAEGHALVVTKAKKVEDWTKAHYTFKAGSSSDYTGSAGYSQKGYETGLSLKLTEDRALGTAATEPLAIEDRGDDAEPDDDGTASRVCNTCATPVPDPKATICPACGGTELVNREPA